jgi:osmoprotectant transport system permease protein
MHVLHFLHAALTWSGPGGVPTLARNQLYLSALVVLIATVLGGSIGLVLGHTGKGSLVAVNAANSFRAVPTLALLTLLVIYPPISVKWDGRLASAIALTVLALPPVLTNTFVGIREVDADVTDAARAMGLTNWQVMSRVELPLALPFIVAGIRTAAIEVVASSTLAAYTGYQDLGTPIFAAVVALAFAALLRAVTPTGVGQRRRFGGLRSAGALPAGPSPG